MSLLQIDTVRLVILLLKYLKINISIQYILKFQRIILNETYSDLRKLSLFIKGGLITDLLYDNSHLNC